MKKALKILTVVTMMLCTSVFSVGADTAKISEPVKEKYSLSDVGDMLKCALGIKNTTISDADLAFDVNGDSVFDLRDVKTALIDTLGIAESENDDMIIEPYTSSGEIVGIFEYNGATTITVKDADGSLGTITSRDNDINVIKDGNCIEFNMLEPGMNITFTCKYVLEIYPARYQECTQIIVK